MRAARGPLTSSPHFDAATRAQVPTPTVVTAGSCSVVAGTGAMALIITLMGFFGGLVKSAIKRDRGVKDWGSMIEGHGGMLDRLDSVIFAAPVFFHLTRYFWGA